MALSRACGKEITLTATRNTPCMYMRQRGCAARRNNASPVDTIRKGQVREKIKLAKEGEGFISSAVHMVAQERNRWGSIF